VASAKQAAQENSEAKKRVEIEKMKVARLEAEMEHDRQNVSDQIQQRLTLKDEEQKTAIQNMAKTTVGLAELMQLTPNSMKQVKKGQQQRSMHSRVLGCVADAERTGKRSSFLEM